MWRRLCVLVVMVAGCWSDDPPVNGLTPDQWTYYAKQFALHGAGRDGCNSVTNCDALVHLGQELFFEPSMSTRMGSDGATMIPGTVSCVTCHDTKKFFIDSRDPNDVSMGATKPTQHNSMTIVNLMLKDDLQMPGLGFSWTGQYGSAIEVIEQLAIPKAMSTDTATAFAAIMKNDGYAAEAHDLWPAQNLSFDNLAIALDAYMRQLVSLDSTFDHWIAGDETTISDSAKRGFVIFVGKGGCASCHSGPAFSDRWVHVTGLKQKNTDDGLGSADSDFEGDFATQGLRNIARTAPYMHDGSLTTLEDVVAFYRRGGDPGGYTGTKDPRIQPLDLTDDDAQDLVEFLKSLNGADIPAQYTKDIRRTITCMPGMLVCNEACVPSDANNCGMCGRTCDASQACVMGTCESPPVCGPGMTDCPVGGCVYLEDDQMHCGSCSNECGPMQMCAMGMCSCPMPMTACGQNCADLNVDPQNCGTCGTVCAASCVNGVCE